MSQPSFRRTLDAHTESYAAKATVQALGIIGTRGLRKLVCDTPYPNYAVCTVFNDSIENQTQDLTTTGLTFGVYAALSLLMESMRRR